MQDIDRMIGVYQRAPVDERGNLEEMATEMVEAENALGADRSLSNSIAPHYMPRMVRPSWFRLMSSVMQSGCEMAQAFHDSRNAFVTVDAEL